MGSICLIPSIFLSHPYHSISAAQREQRLHLDAKCHMLAFTSAEMWKRTAYKCAIGVHLACCHTSVLRGRRLQASSAANTKMTPKDRNALQVAFNGNAAQGMRNDVKKGFPCKGRKCLRSFARWSFVRGAFVQHFTRRSINRAREQSLS